MSSASAAKRTSATDHEHGRYQRASRHSPDICIEVLLDDGVLTLRGEKRSETEDKDRQFSERFYGRFERRIPLGYEVEEDKVAAAFKNGVLTVTLPKSPNAQSKVKRIAINGKVKCTKTVGPGYRARPFAISSDFGVGFHLNPVRNVRRVRTGLEALDSQSNGIRIICGLK